MTAINFPDSPSDGDTHVVGGVTYTYNNAETKWKTTINSNAFLPLSGGTVSGNIVLGGELQHSGDTDTKIAFDTDEINFDTGGSTRATIDSSGRVGIGTTSPTTITTGNTNLTLGPGSSGSQGSEIHMESATNNGSGNGANISYIGSDLYLVNREAGFLSLYTNNNERVRIDSSGDLRFNSGYGSVATAYGVRAWARVNGNGTLSVYGSNGFDVITDQGTGLYRFNFENQMPDTNYSVSGSTGANVIFQVTAISASAWVQTNIQTTSATASDSDHVSIMVVR